jgi:tetratricopeptide (TPR) repeat protein
MSQVEEKRTAEAADNLHRLYSLDPGNEKIFKALNRALEQSGMSERRASLLASELLRHPGRIALLLDLAGITERIKGPSKALPYLSAALKRSPMNKNALYETGMTYEKIGQRALALYYLTASSRHDPGTHRLKQYISFLRGNGSDFSGETWNGSIRELETEADRYNTERAVYLLNETLFRINRDGSFEKQVRCIVKIYDETAIDDFSSQFITYEPGIDSIENIRCTVINDGESMDVQERYTRQLSDPQSRLYYNLEAVMIPVAGLRKGSILDFSYTLKNTGGLSTRTPSVRTYI